MSYYDLTAAEEYIRNAATARGIDPNIAVRVAKSEGLAPNTWQSKYLRPDGSREQSYGPFQLYMGGGLGNSFQRQTGLNPADTSSLYPGIDFALNYAAKNGWGSWYGAKRAGIGNFEGIGADAHAAGVTNAGLVIGPPREDGPQVGVDAMGNPTGQDAPDDAAGTNSNTGGGLGGSGSIPAAIDKLTGGIVASIQAQITSAFAGLADSLGRGAIIVLGLVFVIGGLYYFGFRNAPAASLIKRAAH